MKRLAIFLSILLLLEAMYCFVAFSNIAPIKNLRESYIETALETMTHQWLADYFFPKYMVDEIRQNMLERQTAQIGNNSELPAPVAPTTEPIQPTQPTETVEPTAPTQDEAEIAFYDLFWELNRTSFENYLDDHPETLANGWQNIYINEAGLEDEGTEIYTSMGEQVLAIDAKNKILLVRVQDTGYLGVLAVAKDPAQLRCVQSEGLDGFRYGQLIGTLVDNGGGILGMSGSGFIDPEGDGNGGLLAGFAMCEGVEFGTHDTQEGAKRIELWNNDRFYIRDSFDEVREEVTDAVEFAPALIIDGELAVGGFYDWNGINPRAAIGQSSTGEILMLVIEGRLVTRSIGTDVETCAKILKRHDGYTAMNLDGGTSAIMWFDNEYVTKCSNSAIESRYLPNAWVYGYK